MQKNYFGDTRYLCLSFIQYKTYVSISMQHKCFIYLLFCRGFSCHKFFMEESIWWVACWLQIGVWALYWYTDLSSKGDSGCHSLYILVLCFIQVFIIYFFLEFLFKFKPQLFWDWGVVVVRFRSWRILKYSLSINSSYLQKERKRRWDEKNQEAIAEAVKQLDQFDKVLHHLCDYFLQ